MSKFLNEFKNENGLIPMPILLSEIDKDIAFFQNQSIITTRMLEIGPDHVDFPTLQVQLQQSINSFIK